MRHLMLFQTVLCTVLYATKLAQEGTCVSVKTFIQLRINFSQAYLSTFVTRKITVFHVRGLVNFENVFVHEAFAAEVAFKRTLISMNSLVDFEIMFLFEPFATKSALKCTFVSMNQLVFLEMFVH